MAYTMRGATMRRAYPLSLLVLGCGQDIGVSQVARCDGVLQQAENTVDSPFDRDGDGYLDGANDDCAANYPDGDLDCDDNDPDLYPGADEIPCNDVDDDCDELTSDHVDADADGFFADPDGQCAELYPNDAFDCDDAEALVNPGTDEALCDDLDNDCNAGTPDGLDQDADTYTECTDCADLTPSVNPGTAEISCNNLDDDCNAATIDSPDLDGDGAGTCDDCNDSDPTIGPSIAEVCDDEIDNNCDGDVDEGCSYGGTWDLDSTVSYSCAFGLVSMNFAQVSIEDTNPTIKVTSVGSGTVPGTMNGSFSSDTEFEATRTLTGTCDEIYTVVGTFTGPDEFVGTFTAEYIGNCYDCADKSWFITGTK